MHRLYRGHSVRMNFLHPPSGAELRCSTLLHTYFGSTHRKSRGNAPWKEVLQRDCEGVKGQLQKQSLLDC